MRSMLIKKTEESCIYDLTVAMGTITEQSTETSTKTSNITCFEDPFDMRIDVTNDKYPFCIVWTPIPLISWLFPIIGHMGIATSTGVIRDFAGSYYVSEGNMAFGRPTKYWQLDPLQTNPPGSSTWNSAVADASNVYSSRIHNLFCDNCHSHVALALNHMEYKGSRGWNMIWLCFLMLLRGKYVSWLAIAKTWIPFFILLGFITYVYFLM